jgi:hypothetical protein
VLDSAAAIGLRLAGASRWLNGKVNMSKGLELRRGSKRWWPLPQSFFSTILKMNLVSVTERPLMSPVGIEEC